MYRFIRSIGIFKHLANGKGGHPSSSSCAIVVGAARTLNTAFRRAQLAAFNAVRAAQVPKSAACRLLQPSSSSSSSYSYYSPSMLLSASGLIDSVLRTPVPRLIPPVNNAPSAGDAVECIVHDTQSSTGSVSFTIRSHRLVP